MASVGRISGPLLKADLLRNGIDLAFETDLLYLKVDNQRIGIKTTAPQYELDVNGTTQTTNLRITNVAELGSIRIEGNTISSAEPYLNLATLDTVVSLNRLEVDSISIEGNAITTNSSNADLELRPNGTGTVNVHSDLNVDGNIHATGNISADGDITIGSADQTVPNDDIVRFNAEIASDIIPDATRTYSLGSDPGTGGKEWNDVWVNNLVASSINSQDLELDGIDLTLRHGNIWYVAANGDDANSGDHILDPFGSIKHALEYVGVQAGDVIHVSPGVYTEEFPLTIPAGVTVRGEGLRGVTIQPTVGTNTNDAFLLNGETTIEDVTITGFYSPGYAFKFAPGYIATTRSPYIRNTTVITEGSVTSPTDPRGFDAGDAGKGGFFDGSVADATSNEASALFHSVTFITPGVDAITLTNGVRVEWLNSFTYFANRSIYAVDGASGLKGAGETALRVDGASAPFVAGETIEYYDTDGVTLLESATISSIDATGKIFVSGKQTGFQTAEQRGGKTITANGDAQLSTAVKKFGTASLALDGTGDYASITSQDDFGFGTDDFTVEFWYYQAAGSGTRALADFRSAATQESVYIGTTSAVPFLYINGSFVINSSVTLSNNQWYHIAVTRSGTTARLYVNGVDTGSATVSNDLGSSRSLNIGANYLGTGSFVSGYFDDLRIVKGAAITPPSGGPTTRALVTPETVLMARFDGGNASTTFEDDVVYAQDIRFSGGATATSITLTDFTDFGAEVRLISSASVYGNYGLVGDGPGVLMYAIGHNLAYIGNGKAVTNDPNTVIQANEVVQDNGARIRYNSVDHKGDFRVGDLFYVNQETGNVTFAVSDFTINTDNGVTFITDGETTLIDGTKIETGDWRISGNTVETLTQDANFAAGSGEIYLNSNVNINGSLDVTGNVTIGGNITIGDEETDTIQIIAGIDSDITPKVDSTYSLGEETKQWSNLYVNEIDLDSIVIRDNFIEVVDSNADLELRANGTGNIYVPNNDVQIDNDLTVSGLTTLADTTIVGAVGVTGDYTQTGSYTIDGQFSNSDIIINDNFITTSITNSDLELRASGTGNIYVPSNDVVMDEDLRVYGTTTLADTVINGNTTQVGNTVQTGNINLTGDLSIIGNITISDATQFENINIDDNVIKTTISSSNLELRATQYGDIVIPDNDLVISNDLFVTGTISTGDLNTAGTITANRFSTGDIIIDDNYITTTLSNSNLELRANGTGEIVVPSNNTILEQNLTVNGSTYLQDTTVVGSITHTGNVTQIGDINLTGNLDVTGEVIISASVIQFEQIQLTGNAITTTDSNANLELRANGTGSILIPTNDVQIDNNLSVTGTITVGNVTSVSAITADTFSTGDILINDNYITTTQSNSDLELRTAGTGSVIIDDFDINGSTIATSSDIIIAPGSDIVNINATGALKLPVGDTSERPTAAAGQVRFNTDLARFEGYNGTNWVNLKGVEDLDGNTKVTAELTEGANDNVIRFYIDGSQIVDINSTRLAAPKIDVDDISIDGNVITTTNGNKDLNLTANGTGRITFDNFAFKDNTITNTVTNAVTVIESTGSGYVKFAGSYGIVIPVGASGERPPIEFSETGQIRYNTDDERVEIWDGTNWVSVAGAASGITRNDAEEIALATVLVLG